jgi:hypothetical protein
MAIDPMTKQKFVTAQKRLVNAWNIFEQCSKKFDHELLATIVKDQKFSIAKFSDQKLAITPIGN